MELDEKIKRKNKLYTVMICVIVILFILATFGTESGRNSSLNEKLGLLFLLLFVVAAYLRMYLIYKVEKIKGFHNHKSFIDFFNYSFSTFRWDLILLIIPYFKKHDNRKLEAIRLQINYLTFFVYVFLGLGFYLTQ